MGIGSELQILADDDPATCTLDNAIVNVGHAALLDRAEAPPVARLRPCSGESAEDPNRRILRPPA
jgi:hypothetical protein